MKFQAITPKHVDMAFLELLEFTKNEIGGAFGVPPIFLNDRDGVNYANLREYERMFWRHKMIPELLLIQDWLNQFVNPVFAGPGQIIKTVFDLTQVEALQEDVVKEAEASRIKIFSGQMSPDEAREGRGLPAWPDGSGASAMVPMSFIRLDQAGDILAGKIPATGQTPPKGARARIVKFPRSVFKTPAERMDHVMRIKGLVDEEEGLMKTVLIAVMEDWTQEMLENLGADKALKEASSLTVEQILFNEAAAEVELAAVGGPIFTDTAARAGQQGMALTGAAVAFDLADPAVQAILATSTQRFAEGIAGPHWERMKVSLNEGLAAGESNKVLAERVRDHMGREINNAATIARTEIHPCYESVNLQAYKQSGVVEMKEWLAAFLPRSRQDHTDNDGVQVSLNSAFLVGGEWLDYPGDPGGSAANIINCVCTTAPVVIAPVEPVIPI